MKYPKISTTVNVFKKIISKDLTYTKLLDEIEKHVKEDRFDEALQLEKSLTFSFHKDEDKAQKQLKFILKNQIIHEHIEQLEKTTVKELELAISLIHDTKIEFTSGPLTAQKLMTEYGIYELLSKFEHQSFPMKEAIVEILNSAQSNKNVIKNLKKEIVNLHHL